MMPNSFVCVLAILFCAAGCNKSPQEHAPSPAKKSAATSSNKPSASEAAQATVPQQSSRILASASVPVELSVKSTILADHRVVISGKSNLPAGTKLAVLITPQMATPFRTQYTSNPAVDEAGNFATDPLGNADVGMLPYKFLVLVRVVELSQQPTVVREHFEDQSENLQGPLLVTVGKQKLIQAQLTLDLRNNNPGTTPAEKRQAHAEHVASYLAELKAVQAELLKKQRILEAKSFDTTVNYNWPTLKTRLDALRRDRRMIGEFPELNTYFHAAEQQLEYFQHVLETKQGQYWESAYIQFEQALAAAEEALKSFRGQR